MTPDLNLAIPDEWAWELRDDTYDRVYDFYEQEVVGGHPAYLDRVVPRLNAAEAEQWQELTTSPTTDVRYFLFLKRRWYLKYMGEDWFATDPVLANAFNRRPLAARQ